MEPEERVGVRAREEDEDGPLREIYGDPDPDTGAFRISLGSLPAAVLQRSVFGMSEEQRLNLLASQSSSISREMPEVKGVESLVWGVLRFMQRMRDELLRYRASARRLNPRWRTSEHPEGTRVDYYEFGVGKKRRNNSGLAVVAGEKDFIEGLRNLPNRFSRDMTLASQLEERMKPFYALWELLWTRANLGTREMGKHILVDVINHFALTAQTSRMNRQHYSNWLETVENEAIVGEAISNYIMGRIRFYEPAAVGELRELLGTEPERLRMRSFSTFSDAYPRMSEFVSIDELPSFLPPGASLKATKLLLGSDPETEAPLGEQEDFLIDLERFQEQEENEMIIELTKSRGRDEERTVWGRVYDAWVSKFPKNVEVKDLVSLYIIKQIFADKWTSFHALFVSGWSEFARSAFWTARGDEPLTEHEIAEVIVHQHLWRSEDVDLHRKLWDWFETYVDRRTLTREFVEVIDRLFKHLHDVVGSVVKTNPLGILNTKIFEWWNQRVNLEAKNMWRAINNEENDDVGEYLEKSAEFRQRTKNFFKKYIGYELSDRAFQRLEESRSKKTPVGYPIYIVKNNRFGDLATYYSDDFKTSADMHFSIPVDIETESLSFDPEIEASFIVLLREVWFKQWRAMRIKDHMTLLDAIGVQRTVGGLTGLPLTIATKWNTHVSSRKNSYFEKTFMMPYFDPKSENGLRLFSRWVWETLRDYSKAFLVDAKNKLASYEDISTRAYIDRIHVTSSLFNDWRRFFDEIRSVFPPMMEMVEEAVFEREMVRRVNHTRRHVLGREWNVFGGLNPSKDYVEWLSTKDFEGALRPCLLSSFTYLGYASFFDDPVFSSLYERGLVSEMVKIVEEQGYSVGVLYDSRWYKDVIKPEMQHLYVTYEHVTVIEYVEVLNLHRRQRESVPTPRNLGFTSQDKIVMSRNHQPDLTFETESDVPALNMKCHYKVLDEDFSSYFRNNKFFWDIECFSVEESIQQCYMITAVGWIEGKHVYFHYTSGSEFDDPVSAFCSFLVEVNSWIEPRDVKVEFWGFGSMRYEMKYLLEPLARTFGEVSSFGGFGESKGYHVRNLLFCDARHLYTKDGLKKNTETYCKTFVKLSEMVDISKIVNFEVLNLSIDHVRLYNYFDCLSLMELVERFYFGMWNIIKETEPTHGSRGLVLSREAGVEQSVPTQRWKISLGRLLGKKTNPGIAMMIFEYNFMNEMLVNEDITSRYVKQYDMTSLHNDNYHGGITEVLTPRVKGEKIYYYDINSMYPDRMSQPMPVWIVGVHPHYSNNKELILRHSKPSLLYVHVSFYKFADGKFPFFPERSRIGSTLYLRETATSKWFWGDSVRKLLLDGGSVEILEVIEYTNVDGNGKEWDCLRNYVDYFFARKNKAKGCEKNCMKLLMNSLYGKFGEKVKESHTFTVEEVKPSEQPSFTEERFKKEQKLHNSIEVNENLWHNVFLPPANDRSKGGFARFAEYISASGRLMLATAIDVAGQDQVIYGDTDSTFVKELGSKRMSEAGLLHDTRLGKFKLETMMVKREVDGVSKEIELPCVFTDAIVTARKFYMMKNEHGDVLFKSKGFNWKPDGTMSKGELFDLLAERVDKVLLEKNLDDIARGRYFIGLRLLCERWVFDSKESGNVIQKYLKKVNLTYKRKLNRQGLYMEPLTRSEAYFAGII